MQMILCPIKSKAEVLAEKERLAKAGTKVAKNDREAVLATGEEDEEEEFDDSIFEDVVLESDAIDDDSELEITDEEMAETIVAAETGGTSMPVTLAREEEKEEEEMVEEPVPVAGATSEPEAESESAALQKPERVSDPLADLLKKPPARPPLPGLSRPRPSVPAHSGDGSGRSDSSSLTVRQRRARAAPVSAATSALLQKTKSRVNVEPPLEPRSPISTSSTSGTKKATNDELVSTGSQKATVDENDPLANLRRPVRPPT